MLIGVSYLSIVIIVIGLIFNTSAFLVFTCSKKMRGMSSMIFLAFICVTDISALFTWNLNHFLEAHQWHFVEYISVHACRFFNWLQYFSLQCSGLFYSLVSVDRYFTISAMPGSFYSKLPFGTPKSALIWSISIIFLVAVLNSHMLFMHGYTETVTYNITKTTVMPVFNATANITQNLNLTLIIGQESNEEIICYKSKSGDYILNPMWDYANIVIYNFLPVIIMAIFNTLLIRVTFGLKKAVKKDKEDKQTIEANKRKRRLTISLFLITVAFLIMTLPGNILYAFFFNQMKATSIGYTILIAVDYLIFFHHVSIFFICFATNSFFREIVICALRSVLIKLGSLKISVKKRSKTTKTEMLSAI